MIKVAGCIRGLLVLVTGWSLLAPAVSNGQAPARLENRPGIVAFKRYAWSQNDDLMATEFTSYVDRRADFQANRGYVQFRLAGNQIRQVPSESLVEIVHYADLAPPPNLVTPEDLRALESRIAKAEKVSGYSEPVATLVAPYLLALKNDRDQFQGGRLKIAGAWRSRAEHVTAMVNAVLAEVTAGQLATRKLLEARLQEVQSSVGDVAFKRQFSTIRDAWFGWKLDGIESALASGMPRNAGDLLETFRMDLGSTSMSKTLQRRLETLTAGVADAVMQARRSELLQELRDAGTAQNRKAVLVRELEQLGVTRDEDKAFIQTVKERLDRSQSANRAVLLIKAQSGSLLDAAARRRVESGALFLSGDTGPADLSAQIAAAWRDMPESEHEARSQLADLQTLIETAGKLNFHLSSGDWKSVPELAARLRDAAERTGTGQTLVEGVDTAIQKRRDEVTEVLATARAAEADGRRSDAFQLYLKAQEMLPDGRAEKEVRRLGQQALGL